MLPSTKRKTTSKERIQKPRAGKRRLASIKRPSLKNPDLRAHLLYTSTVTKAFMQHLARKKFRYKVGRESKQIVAGDVELISLSAGLHDLGKTREAVHKAIAGTKKLNPNRRDEMRKHVTEGVEIINEISNGLLGNKHNEVINTVKSHHEHWNGSGYPERLHGTQIPIGGRIISVVDVFCALTEKRSYKEGESIFETLKILQKESGKLFDPAIVNEFLEFAENRDFKLYQPKRRINPRR